MSEELEFVLEAVETGLAKPGEKKEATTRLDLEISEEGGGNEVSEPQINGDPPREDSAEHMEVVERHLDDLTLCGSTINDLEIQLERTKASYRKMLGAGKRELEDMRKKLGACIPKSQPFIEVWRRARQVQEESNRAAAQFDKASSQYAAAKEMIRVAEMQLGAIDTKSDSPKTTALNHAWQEMLNHATIKVVETEREKRESEVEHRQVLDKCTQVLDEYRVVEKRLRPQIVKSRPYFELRWKYSQRLSELKSRIQSLEDQLQQTKQRYSGTLRHLETLNHTIHEKRRASSLTPASSAITLPLTSRQTISECNTPDYVKRYTGAGQCTSDSESVQSWQVTDGVEFTGSTGSLPSVGSSSLSESSEDPSYQQQQQGQKVAGGENPVITVTNEDQMAQVARSVVERSLSAAVARLEQLSLQHSPSS